MCFHLAWLPDDHLPSWHSFPLASQPITRFRRHEFANPYLACSWPSGGDSQLPQILRKRWGLRESGRRVATKLIKVLSLFVIICCHYLGPPSTKNLLAKEGERGRAMILLLYFSTLLLVTWRPRYCYYHYCRLCYVIWRSCFVSPFLSARYRNMFCSYCYDIQLQSWLQHRVSRCSYS